MLKIALVMVVLTRISNASPIDGDAATRLAQALRYAAVAPKIVGDTRTFRVAAITCSKVLDKDQMLGDHGCKLDKLDLKGVAAYVMYEALSDAGARAAMKSGPERIELATANLACVVDAAKRTAQCDWDGSPPKPVTIVPKKQQPVKDIVQPVKIEKQK